MINVIDVDSYIRSNKLQGPVISPQIFVGKSYNFHPQGLMSEDIFGIDGSVERNISMSWIDINCNVIHPVLYDIISKRVERKIPKIISGEITCDLNDKGELIDSEEDSGILRGITDLFNNINTIRFRKTDSSLRNKTIDVIYKNIKNKTFFLNKLIVTSPTFRNVEVRDVSERKEISVDELTKLYRRIIELSIQLKSVSGSIFDVLSYRMQILLRDLYELVRLRVAKKNGLIRRMMLGKRVDFSGRAVISPNPELSIGEVGIPFKMICSLFEPYIIYGATHSGYAHNITNEFYVEAKRYLGKEIYF